MTKLFFAMVLLLSLNSFAEALTTRDYSEFRPGGASTIASGIECEGACKAIEKAELLLSDSKEIFHPGSPTGSQDGSSGTPVKSGN